MLIFLGKIKVALAILVLSPIASATSVTTEVNNPKSSPALAGIVFSTERPNSPLSLVKEESFPDRTAEVAELRRVEAEAKAAAEVKAKADLEAAQAAERAKVAATPPPAVGGALAAPVKPSGDVKALAFEMAVARGWGGYWPTIEILIQKESGWIVGNVNKSSGACGLGQALPCSKMGSAYGNAAGEINWTYNYIAGRYGTPGGAWSHWQSRGWY